AARGSCSSSRARRARVRGAGGRGSATAPPGSRSQAVSGGAAAAGGGTGPRGPPGQASAQTATAGDRIRYVRGLLRMEEGSPRRGVNPRVIAAQVCEALNRSGSKYLVIGGVACILHGYARTREDVDVLIER